MTALGTWIGVNRDLAGRLPVAVLSLLFLLAFFLLLKREFGPQVAAIASVLLATSAGWLAYSELCLTDIPVAVFFSFAVLFSLPLLRKEPDASRVKARFILIGICIGLGALAKGLVPIALAVPFLWFLRRYWRYWWLAVAASIVVALPWYAAVYIQNGYPFIQDFFVRHHFQRLYSASLQHVQPWFYYFPVLLTGLFPWTPALGLLAVGRTSWDERRSFLLTVVIFGFLIFSITLNKLPGYILPLLPSLVLVVAAQFEKRQLLQLSKGWFFACASLIAMLPLMVLVLPSTLTLGKLSVIGFRGFERTALFYVALPILVVALARRSWIPPLLVLCVVAGGIYLKAKCYPLLDRQKSARVLWREVQPIANELCDGGTNRDWIYGLSFYRGAAIPVCGAGHYRFVIRSTGHSRPTITPIDSQARR